MRRLALAALLVLVSACATYPPPKIEGNRYQNYRYGFTLELPGEPWKQTEKLPAWFESWMHSADLSTSTIKLALFNNQTNAFIVVNCWKDPQNIYRISDSGAYRAFEYLLELEKEESLKSDRISRFEYDVGPWTPRLHWTVEMDTETEVQKTSVIRKGNNYPIHDDTHFIEIMLWSNQLTFIENKRVFYNFYESFEWGEHLMKSTIE
jgi:hypothetical protein